MRLKSLVPSTEVLSGRNLGSWMGLAFAAGSVNATALAACHRFVTHVTGTVTHIGVNVGSWGLVAEYAVVLGCFVLGAMTAVLLLDGRRIRGLASLPWLPLATVSALLAGCGIAGHLGAFGPFGGQAETRADFAFLSILAFALGLQNASVANATGSQIRSTHMTGPATDLGVALALLMLRNLPREHDRAARQTVRLRGGQLFAFAVGGAASAISVVHLEYLALLVPAVICAVVAAHVFGSIRIPMAVRRPDALMED